MGVAAVLQTPMRAMEHVITGVWIGFVLGFVANCVEYPWHAWRTREPQQVLLALGRLLFLVVGVHDLGVVLEQHPQSLLTPKVKVFFSAKSKAPIPQEVLDLSKLVGRERIVGREAEEDWGFRTLEEFWSGERKGRNTLFR